MKKAFKQIIVGLALFGLTVPAHSAEVAGVDIHGFISQGYLQTSDNNFLAQTEDGTFEFNEFGINFGKELTDKMRVGLQLFSKDLGDYGNNEVVIDWAYGDYRWKDWLGVRVGKVKAPHGLYNETRDVDMLRNSIFLPQSVYPEVARDATLNLMGGGAYGNVDMGLLGGLNYQAYAGTQNIDANEHLAQTLMGVTYGGTEVSNKAIDVDRKYAAGLTWDTPLDGLRIGGTYQRSDMQLISDYDFSLWFDPTLFPPGAGIGTSYIDSKSENYVVSAEYTWNNLLVAAEYFWADREIAYNQLDFATGGEVPTFEKHKPMGWYVQAAYRFTDWFELGAYYSEYYAERDNKDGEDTRMDPVFGETLIISPSHRAWLKDICLTTRFDVNEYWTVKLEAHQMDGSNQLSGFDNPMAPDDPYGLNQLTDDWQMYAAKVTFSF
jgi:hypothetical protein